MILAKEIIGNIYADEAYGKMYDNFLKDDKLEKVLISSKDRKKNKIRISTDKDSDVGIIVTEEAKLSSGDVIFCDEHRMIIVEVKKDYALVVDFDENINRHELLMRAVKFGHLIGNQHWTLMTKGNSVYLPIAIDKEVMETIIYGGNIPEITIRYEEIDQSDFEEYVHHHP